MLPALSKLHALAITTSVGGRAVRAGGTASVAHRAGAVQVIQPVMALEVEAEDDDVGPILTDLRWSADALLRHLYRLCWLCICMRPIFGACRANADFFPVLTSFIPLYPSLPLSRCAPSSPSPRREPWGIDCSCSSERHAQVQGVELQEQWRLVRAEVPLSAMVGYARVLRQLTSGR